MDNDMTSLLRRIVFTLAATCGIATSASASTFSVDYTDLWYIPAESGWGLNLIQQNNVIFATLFVYGSDSTPRWYVASDLESANGTGFSGVLYRTSGPYFGNPWTGGNASVPAGSMSLTFNTTNSATLTYTADGVTVTKQIQRQTWKGENLTGSYLGGLTAAGSQCASGTTDILMFGTVAVAHNTSSQAATLTINFTTGSGGAATCTFAGTYGQNGRQGNINGNFSCTVNGAAANSGVFNVTELESSIRGFNGRFQGKDQFCTYDGNIGVMRDIP
jgi:hypothetical protein